NLEVDVAPLQGGRHFLVQQMAKLCGSSRGAVRKTPECPLDLAGGFVHLRRLCPFIHPARTFVSSHNGVMHENTSLPSRQARFAQDRPSELQVRRQAPVVSGHYGAKQVGPTLPNQS